MIWTQHQPMMTSMQSQVSDLLMVLSSENAMRFHLLEAFMYDQQVVYLM